MLLSIQSVDFYILDFLQTMARSSFWDKFFSMFTSLGDPVMILCYCALLVVMKKTRRDGVMVTCGALIGLAVGNGLLKLLIRRDRPCWLRPEIDLLVKNPSDYSFPSGHTMHIAILSVILIYNHPKLAYALIPLTLLMAYSRMYLYLHFPSDVLGGLILGVGIGLLVCWLFPKAEKKFSGRKALPEN